MPKYRSGKINEEALVSTQACIITRQKLKFWNFCIWILISSPFSTPTQGRKMLGAARTEMNHLLVSVVFPDRVGSCQHPAPPFWSTSEGHLSRAWALRTEQPLRTPCSPQSRFILHPKDLNFLEDFYLFRLLRTPAIPTSVWDSRKNKCSSSFPCIYLLPF